MTPFKLNPLNVPSPINIRNMNSTPTFVALSTPADIENKPHIPRQSQKININDYGYDQSVLAQARKSVDVLLKNGPKGEEVMKAHLPKDLNTPDLESSLKWGGLALKNESEDLQSRSSS